MGLLALFFFALIFGYIVERPRSEDGDPAVDAWFNLEQGLLVNARSKQVQKSANPILRSKLLNSALFPKTMRQGSQGGGLRQNEAALSIGAPSLPIIVAASIVDGKLELISKNEMVIIVGGIGDQLNGWTILGSDLVTVDLTYGDVRERVDIEWRRE